MRKTEAAGLKIHIDYLAGALYQNHQVYFFMRLTNNWFIFTSLAKYA